MRRRDANRDRQKIASYHVAGVLKPSEIPLTSQVGPVRSRIQGISPRLSARSLHEKVGGKRGDDDPGYHNRESQDDPPRLDRPFKIVSEAVSVL